MLRPMSSMARFGSSRLTASALVPATSSQRRSKSQLILTPADVASFPQTRVTDLPSGIRVATEHTPGHEHTCSMAVWIDVGSRFEDESNNGAAHYLEHLAFKGTPTRSRPQLEREIEQMGAHLNAYTGRETTTFVSSSLAKDMPAMAEIVADILSNSEIDAQAVENERHVILREMEEVYQREEELVFDKLHETCMDGSPLGYTILGPEKNIKTLSREQISAFKKKYWTADRMVVAAAGAVDHDEVVKMVEKTFASVPKGPKSEERPQALGAKFIGSQYEQRMDSWPRAHVAYGFPVPGATHESYTPLTMITAAIGSWEIGMDADASPSRLVEAAAQDKFADRFYAFHSPYADISLVGIYGETSDPYKVNEMASSFAYEMTRLAKELDDAQLDAVREMMKTDLLNRMSGSSADIVDEIGREMLMFGRRIPPAELFARLDFYNAADVRRVATDYFNDQDHCLAAVGPIFELPDITHMRRKSKWNRTAL